MKNSRFTEENIIAVLKLVLYVLRTRVLRLLPEKHSYELLLTINDIEHRTTKIHCREPTGSSNA